LIPIPAGRATLGQSRENFGWDNEFDEHVVDVGSFRISKHKITNGEYLKFVAAGGKVAQFWVERQGKWFLQGMFEEIPLPLDWPVYTTQSNAAEYAKWIGKALPTEAQFHRAAYGTPDGSERPYPWGSEQPGPEHGNFDFHRWDPASVTAHPLGESAFG